MLLFQDAPRSEEVQAGAKFLKEEVLPFFSNALQEELVSMQCDAHQLLFTAAIIKLIRIPSNPTSLAFLSLKTQEMIEQIREKGLTYQQLEQLDTLAHNKESFFNDERLEITELLDVKQVLDQIRSAFAEEMTLDSATIGSAYMRAALLGCMQRKKEITDERALFENLPVAKAVGYAESIDCRGFTDCDSQAFAMREGDIQSVNYKRDPIKISDLEQQGLLPTKSLTLGDVSYYCSNPFKIGPKHLGVFAFVEIEGKLFPRLFYHSNSQGTWRVMPFGQKGQRLDDFGMPEGEQRVLRHFGKGKFESDTELPLILTMALNTLPSRELMNKEQDVEKVVETVLMNRALAFPRCIEVEELMKLKQGAPQHFVREGLLVPRCPDPKMIELPSDERLHPNFTEELISSKANIPMYGEVTMRLFPSVDKTMLYLIYEAVDGKIFLASSEMVAAKEINAFGVRPKAAQLHGMDAPLLEYFAQIPREYKPFPLGINTYDCEEGTYYCNWNFVSELPLIELYYRQRRIEMPTPLRNETA